MFNLDKKIVKVKIGDLKPFGGNPRHNNESAKQVAKSIESFGYINPIVVDDEFVILAGNTRFKAIQLLGLSKEDEIDVLQVCGLTNEQKRGFVIADNRCLLYTSLKFRKLKNQKLQNLKNPKLRNFIHRKSKINLQEFR